MLKAFVWRLVVAFSGVRTFVINGDDDMYTSNDLTLFLTFALYSRFANRVDEGT